MTKPVFLPAGRAIVVYGRYGYTVYVFPRKGDITRFLIAEEEV